MKKLMQFIKDEEGVTAIEYSLIAGLLAIVIIGAVTAAGTQVSAMFDAVAGALEDAIPAAPAP